MSFRYAWFIAVLQNVLSDGITIRFFLECATFTAAKLTGEEESKSVEISAVEAQEGGVIQVLWVVKAPLTKDVSLVDVAFHVAGLLQHDDVVSVRTLLTLTSIVVGVGV